MNILYDGRIFHMQKAGGVNRYFAEVIHGLPENWKPVILWAKDLGRNAPHHPRLTTSDPLEFRPRRFRERVDRQLRFAPAMRRADLLHPTYYELSRGVQLSDVKCPLVVTAYDFVVAKHQHVMTGGVTVAKTQEQMLRRADHVVCISKYTEQDLLERIPSAAGKTSVIYLGTSFEILKGPVPASESCSFLYVGVRRGYKNFSLLLRAFAAASERNAEIVLKVAGEPFTEEERWEMHYLGVSAKVINVPFPDEIRLQELYRESLALLYPSRHEGFGIPPLEAMACQTVAVTSNTTCLPEVVGDGGIMLDPLRADEWTECISQIAERKVNRALLIQKGTARVQNFSWKKCADDHVSLYKAMGKRG